MSDDIKEVKILKKLEVYVSKDAGGGRSGPTVVVVKDGSVWQMGIYFAFESRMDVWCASADCEEVLDAFRQYEVGDTEHKLLRRVQGFPEFKDDDIPF